MPRTKQYEHDWEHVRHDHSEPILFCKGFNRSLSVNFNKAILNCWRFFDNRPTCLNLFLHYFSSLNKTKSDLKICIGIYDGN